MIKQFNKNGALALYKREFAKCLEDSDYEGAIQNLIKFSEAKENPDFHVAMGMLYLAMTQDSEDAELLTLAFREFMMHLIDHPDSRVAYRSLLVVAMLRHDVRSIMTTSELATFNGQNVGEFFNELADMGLTIFSDEIEYVDFDSMFTAADYGAITDNGQAGANGRGGDGRTIEQDNDRTADGRSKVIRFKGNSGSTDAAVKQGNNKIIRLKNDNAPVVTDIDPDDMLDFMMSIAHDDEKADDDRDDLDIFEDDEEDKEDADAKLALKNAQSLCMNGKFDEALAELDKIGRDKDRLYYCSECVKSNIMMELDMFKEAQLALDRALSVVPGGALAGTIQCSLYEKCGQCDKIPETLKSIDVADYIDSDHAFRALMFATKYCTHADALALAEEYIDEFNSFDLRSIYAQMLYNDGNRAAAEKELKILADIQYDDFNARYYYLMANARVEKMPLEYETPQQVLGMLVDSVISFAQSELFAEGDEILKSEPFRYQLEVFLTLEFRNTRSVIKVMFQTLHILAADGRLEKPMRNALVSPYVEPLVKAVILGELLCKYKGDTKFFAERSYCPACEVGSEFVGKNRDDGIYYAYALTLFCCPNALMYFARLVKKHEKRLRKAGFLHREIAYFLWRTVKTKFKYKDKDTDERVHYALGFDTKAQANAAYKSLSAFFSEIDT